MGLDMFVFKIDPPSDDPNVKYTYNELSSRGYDLLEDHYMQMSSYNDLRELAVPFTVVETTYDFAKLQADFGFACYPHVKKGENGEIIFSYGQKSVSLKGQKLGKYIVLKELIYWAFFAKEIAYWRKDYDLCDAIHRSFEDDGCHVENCGYHKLTVNQIKTIQDTAHKLKVNLWQYPDDSLFYFESY